MQTLFIQRQFLLGILCLLCLISLPLKASDNLSTATSDLPDATILIKQALETWRGKSSFSEIEMTIHRPDWQRQSKLKGWTKGMDQSLIRFIAPAKDAGNATLKLDKDMWLFTPKLNRVTKLPTSMMSQSWMGSDFSYNDLAKGDQILTDYDAKIVKAISHQAFANQLIYQLELTPKTNAPVVWGKEVLWIREDGLLLQETFYDQTFKAVKSLRVLEEATIDNKPYPVRMQMVHLEDAEKWTEIRTLSLWFDLGLPINLFTQTYLKSPKLWQPSTPSQLSNKTVKIPTLGLSL